MYNDKEIKILLLGYCGANNTGSEIRIITIVEDIKKAFPNAQINIASFNKDNTLKIIQETDKLKILSVPFIFPLDIWQLTKKHDLTLLVEGSTFKDNWSSILLYLFLWAAWCANKHGKLCIAYAVDAGNMSRLNKFLSYKVASTMPLIITRTEQAKQILQNIGIKQKIIASTDTAFSFEQGLNLIDNHDTIRMHSAHSRKIIGISPVEFYEWPVKIKFLGKKEDCYNWPYYFSWTKTKRLKSKNLIKLWVDLIIYSIDKYEVDIKLIAMEQLDTKICNKILQILPAQYKQYVYTCYAGEYTPQQIVRKLRGLDYLITSRYHACVLSMEAKIPQMCLYHDERLESIYKEMHLQDLAIKYDRENLSVKMQANLDKLITTKHSIIEKITHIFNTYFLPKCNNNYKILQDWYVNYNNSKITQS